MKDTPCLCHQCGEYEWRYLFSTFERGKCNVLKGDLYLRVLEELPLEREDFFHLSCGFCDREEEVGLLEENLSIPSREGEKLTPLERMRKVFFCPECGVKGKGRRWEYIRKRTHQGDALLYSMGEGNKRAVLLEPDESEMSEYIRCLSCGYIHNILA